MAGSIEKRGKSYRLIVSAGYNFEGKQISTTLNFYVHPLLSHNRIAGSALQNLLLPPTNQV